MGLDMYLHKRFYIGGAYDENPDAEIEFTTEKFGRKKNWSFRLGEVESIDVLAMQWRKAYSIDNWFMNLRDYANTFFYVSHEQLLEFYDIISQVRADHSKAAELLPIDDTPEDWYWDDLEATYSNLAGLVEEIRYGEADFDLYYEHSA